MILMVSFISIILFLDDFFVPHKNRVRVRAKKIATDVAIDVIDLTSDLLHGNIIDLTDDEDIFIDLTKDNNEVVNLIIGTTAKNDEAGGSATLANVGAFSSIAGGGAEPEKDGEPSVPNDDEGACAIVDEEAAPNDDADRPVAITLGEGQDEPSFVSFGSFGDEATFNILAHGKCSFRSALFSNTKHLSNIHFDQNVFCISQSASPWTTI